MREPRRNGITLVELIVGIALMALVAAALSAMSQHVLQASESVERVNQSSQEVAVIQRQFEKLTGSRVVTEDFPGIRIVVSNSGRQGIAIRDRGTSNVPLRNELVFLTCNPSQPNELCLFRSNDTQSISGVAVDAIWTAVFEATVNSGISERTVLTSHLAQASDVGTVKGLQFWQEDIRPSATELSSYADGLIDWEELEWPQSNFTAAMGSQRHHVRGTFFIEDQAGNAVPISLSFQFSRTIRR